MGRTISRNAYLSNLKGAYTESLLRSDLIEEGWSVLSDIKHVNAAGYDVVSRRTGILRASEAKAITEETFRRSGLELFSEYFYSHKATDTLRLNTGSFTEEMSKVFSQGEVQQALRTGRLEVNIYINGPESEAVKSLVVDQIGDRVVTYIDDLGVEHTVKVIVEAVSK